MQARQRRRGRRTLAAAAAVTTIVALGPAAGSAPATDRQANAPQVQGVATSDTTAVFPTNKQNEPTIAVHPLNPQILLAGANDEQRQPPCGPGPVRGTDAEASDCSFFPGVGTSGVYRSLDGGATWTNLGLLDDDGGWLGSDLVSDGDPVLAFGPRPAANGTFSWSNGVRVYYSTLASWKPGRSPYPPTKAPEVIAVTWSDDLGDTWSAPVIATVKDNPNDFNDKEWIAVDDTPASPYFGRVYVSWTEFRSATATGNGSEPVMVAYSADGGRTFSAPNQTTPAGNNGTGNGRQGSMPAVGPDGTVYVAFEQGFTQAVVVSRDGGRSWTRPIVVGPVTDLDDPIPGANFRTSSFPNVAADPRSGSQTVYVAWADRTANGGRIVVARSTDRGATWSAPVTVSTAAEGYAFFQGLDVAPNGRVDVAYQALKATNPATFGTGNARIDAWYTSSTTGTSWTTPVRVSSQSSDPAVSAQNNLARQFWGDYNQLVSTTAQAWFIFTDSRSGAGCAAVDAYQRSIVGTSAIRGDMADRVARRLGQDPYADEPVTKPAPQVSCSSRFGNTNEFVARLR